MSIRWGASPNLPWPEAGAYIADVCPVRTLSCMLFPTAEFSWTADGPSFRLALGDNAMDAL
ncbi:hypothetical protein PHISCL_03020 [Aspergillus sclerotialis]|uniref:Uncharacterized protein n=1 Tax=Aspergillus sclerotialis TaxID=2070753 RepID=A0A3A2ZZ49_9EURO|nr:hypothetical protein PHISCL_03020 [Aspergillus sclerotialis]